MSLGVADHVSKALEECGSLKPTGTQRDLLNDFFKTGNADPALSDETLANYSALANNALNDPAKSSDVARLVQTDRLEQINRLLKARGGQ